MNKETIRKYIEDRNKLTKDFYDKLQAQDDKFCEELVKSIPIKIGTIIKVVNNSNVGIYGSKVNFYKVIRFKANTDGTACIIANKRKIDGNFGVREITLCCISYHNDFKLDDKYEIVNECL